MSEVNQSNPDTNSLACKGVNPCILSELLAAISDNPLEAADNFVMAVKSTIFNLKVWG